MKNKNFGVIEVILILIIVIGLALIFKPVITNLIFGCAEQTKEPEVPEPKEEKITEPVPLVIETTQWTPHGVFEGTIVISGEGIEDSGYEGIMYIEPDGKYIRISCTEAVRSRYGELF